MLKCYINLLIPQAILFFSFIIVVDSTTERLFGFCQCFSQVGSDSIKGNLIGFI